MFLCATVIRLMCCLVDLTSWQAKIAADNIDDDTEEITNTISDSQQQQLSYDGRILTIGCCGLSFFLHLSTCIICSVLIRLCILSYFCI